MVLNVKAKDSYEQVLAEKWSFCLKQNTQTQIKKNLLLACNEDDGLHDQAQNLRESSLPEETLDELLKQELDWSHTMLSMEAKHVSDMLKEMPMYDYLH